MDLSCCIGRCKERGTDDEPPNESIIRLHGIVGTPIFLHVYHLDSITSKLNQVTVPLLNTGAFHVGVEVYGKEYSFGNSMPGESGIVVSPRAKEHPFHIYMKTVYRGFAPISEAEWIKLLKTLARKMRKTQYNILMNNCVTFADELCASLDVRGIPSWIINLKEPAISIKQQRSYEDDYQDDDIRGADEYNDGMESSNVATTPLNSKAQRHFEEFFHMRQKRSSITVLWHSADWNISS